MFNSRAFNERIFNYSPINYVTATLDVTLDVQCNPSVKANASVAFDINSDLSCEFVRRRMCSVDFTVESSFDVATRAYIAAFNKGIRIESGEVLTMPIKNNISETEGTIQCIIYPLRDYGTAEQFLFDAGGSDNKNLQVFIKTNGQIALRYGTGITTQEIVGGTIEKEKPYKVAWGWSKNGAKLFLNGEMIGSSTAVPDFDFGVLAYIGNSSGVKTLDGIMDDFHITSYMKTDAEIAEDSARLTPLPATTDTMYQINFDDTLDVSAACVWTSPVIDCSKATDKSSGKCSVDATISGSAVMYTQSRSAPSANGPWSQWENTLADGSLQHEPQDFIQIRVVFSRGENDNPSIDTVTVSFDGHASTTLLVSDFTEGGSFYFATLADYCVMVNGVDAPRKYDGTNISVLGGDPPHANYIAVHKNRMWMAKGSRLYFSELLDVEEWPVLNFIDISPNDGDYITGIKQVNDYLVISKQHSIWLLSGDTSLTFAVRRIHADKGAYAPRSLTMVNDTLCFISDDGVYFSDLVQAVLISERVKKFWSNLNSRRLNQVACWHANHKLYIAVPSVNSLINDKVIVYDSLRQCFVGIIPNWNISCFVEFREGGKRIDLFGHSNKGQISQLEAGYSDNGVVIPFKWKSRELDFDAPEVLKRWNQIFMDIVPASTDVALKLTFYVDGAKKGPMTVTVPGDSTGLIHSLVAYASKAGVIDGRRMAIQIEQDVLDNPIVIHGINIEYMVRGLKPSVYA